MSSNFNNKKVVITRPRERADVLAELICEKGGEPLIFPTLELELVESDELRYIAENISSFDWIIFTSPAGVTSFFNVYNKEEIPCDIAVIGIKTEEELLKHNNKSKIVPDKFTAEGLLESFKTVDLKNKKIALPRTLSARKTLPEGLIEYGADVLVAEAYTSGIPKDITKILDLSSKIINGEIDIITFTSPLTVTNLLDVVKNHDENEFNDLIDALKNKVIVGSIGPITGKVLIKNGVDYIEPEKYTVKNMINAILENID